MSFGLLERAPQENAERGDANPDGLAVGTDELRPIMKDVVFVHIPKTAGTTIRAALVAAMPDAVKIFDYGKNTAAVGGAFVDEPRTPEGILALREKVPVRDRLLVCGHLTAANYLGAFHPASFVTFLRDPVERIVSSYQHFAKHYGFTGAFEQFIELPAHINMQSKMLWGLDLRDIGFIGLTESLQSVLPALSRHIGVPLQHRRENVGGGGPQIDDRLRERILVLNDDDVRLYRYVEANLDYFTNYRRRRDLGPVIARGRVRLRGNVLQGWAVPLSPGRPVEVDVKSGARVLHRCVADQFLPNLKKRGQATHGVGGFSLRLPHETLAAHGELRVVIAGTDKDLEGSPVAPQP